ncbi:MAG TPA: 2-phospho-L-lactate guanylyltransferase [Acidimicrobiia bacterium]|nr:2-phospho-L-lactate guanylyltransferase [Acidimicrobiia bacterium]
MIGAVIPIKPFSEAKRRLAGEIDDVRRRALATMSAAHVVAICHAAGLRITVVTADDEVAAWSGDRGCAVLEDPGDGLSQAVTAAVAATEGPWLVVHADLPLLVEREVRSAMAGLGDGRAVLAPSRDGGTNMLGVAEPIAFAYGRSSFTRHLAATAHLERTVIVSPGTVVDIDGPDDLRRAAALPGGAWLQPFLTSGP